MADEIKHNITEHSTWLRVLYMLIFFIIYSLAEIVLGAVVIFQFLSRLLTAKLNANLLKFGAELSLYAYNILMFLTYNSETKPFPFSEWTTNPDAANVETTKKKKPKATKLKKKEAEEDDGQNSGV